MFSGHHFVFPSTSPHHFMRDLLVIAEWWPSSAPHHHLAPSRGDGMVAMVNHTFRPVEGEGGKYWKFFEAVSSDSTRSEASNS